MKLYCSHKTGDEYWFIATVAPDDAERPRRDNRRQPMAYTNRDREQAHNPTFQGGARSLYCIKCKRDPQVSPDRLTEIVTTADAAGIREMDVSRFPFAT